MLTKRGLHRAWIAPVLAMLLLAGAFLLPRQQETEYAIIQAIIKHIEDYRSEIEGWGYRVSVLSDGSEAPADTCLTRYQWAHAGPVLLLTDGDGGMYCFYHGFDQYASEIARPETVPTFYPERESVDALKIVRLQIYKSDIRRAPLFENTAAPDSPSYYDMEVRLYTHFVAPEGGEALHVSIGDAVHGYFTTRYCSNNFADCKWFGGIDPASANRYADRHIKEAYSEAELLAYYRQGLALQSRLMALFHERRSGRISPCALP